MRKALKIARQYRRKHAGWWAVDSDGSSRPPPVFKGRLQNAVPGVDPDEGALYIGDGPLDIMIDAINKIDLEYRGAWDRPATPEELKAILRSEIRTVDYVVEKEGGLDYNEWVDKVAEATGLTQRQVLSLSKDTQYGLEKLWRELKLHQLSVRQPNKMKFLPGTEPGITTWEKFKEEAELSVAWEKDQAAALLGQCPNHFRTVMDRHMPPALRVAKAHFYKKHAGWWRIESPDRPGIAPPPGYTGEGLLNAIPGQHPAGGETILYNGDGPADVMDAALSDMDILYRAAWGRPMTYEEAQAVFNFCSSSLQKYDPGVENKWLDQLQMWTGIEPQTVAKLPEKLRDEIKKEFRYRIWGCFPNGKGPCNENLWTPSPEGIAAIKRFALNKIEQYAQADPEMRYYSEEFNYPEREEIP